MRVIRLARCRLSVQFQIPSHEPIIMQCFHLCVFASLSLLLVGCEDRVQIGSKQFTESVILGEVLHQLGETTEHKIAHKRDLGGTEVLWQALLKGEIDAYPEYTGTITQQILDDPAIKDFEELQRRLADKGIKATQPLGFNNTYALGVPRQRAQELGLRSISDLKQHPELKLGFSFEFLERQDGWPGLQRAYGLPQSDVHGMDHTLAYEGIRRGAIDVMDLYSTDAEIQAYDLVTLEDNREYFPGYEAVILYRADLQTRAPDLVQKFHQLEGAMDNQTMAKLNAEARIEKIPEQRVAVNFLKDKFNLGLDTDESVSTWQRRLLRLGVNTREHLLLVATSLIAAVLVAIPLGVVAYRVESLQGMILSVVGIIQTMPSLALLVFMIPLFGLGALPAIVALFLYSLLPIVRNTLTGLSQMDPSLKESASVLGLSSWQRLWLIELPMASPSILAGIKTAAVINVGTATLGALINAGGYGQPILTGLRLGDTSLLLQGAIPAAVLAIFVQWGFDLLERFIVPAGLRSSGAT